MVPISVMHQPLRLLVAMSAKAPRIVYLLLCRMMLVLELGRVRFLVYSPMAYALGVTCATWGNGAESFSFSMFARGQFFVSCTHMLTHFFNEYYDFKADSLHQFPSPWTGGSRVLPSGRVLPRTSLWLGCALTAASITVIWLTFPGLDSKVIGAVIVVFSIGYSVPPMSLNARGMGEADVMLVLNLLVPILGFLLFRSTGGSSALLLCVIPPAVVEFVRMMVMNMADVVGDAQARKLTLVVRLGLDRSAVWHTVGMSAAYGILVALYLSGNVPLLPFLLQLCTLPMGALICYRLYCRREYRSLVRSYNLPYFSSQHNGFILLAALLGLVWCDPQRSFLSELSQQRLIAVHFFSALNGWKAFKGWQKGALSTVFNPQISARDRVEKSVQIQQWEIWLTQATRPFKQYEKYL